MLVRQLRRKSGTEGSCGGHARGLARRLGDAVGKQEWQTGVCVSVCVSVGEWLRMTLGGRRGGALVRAFRYGTRRGRARRPASRGFPGSKIKIDLNFGPSFRRAAPSLNRPRRRFHESGSAAISEYRGQGSRRRIVNYRPAGADAVRAMRGTMHCMIAIVCSM